MLSPYLELFGNNCEGYQRDAQELSTLIIQSVIYSYSIKKLSLIKKEVKEEENYSHVINLS